MIVLCPSRAKRGDLIGMPNSHVTLVQAQKLKRIDGFFKGGLVNHQSVVVMLENQDGGGAKSPSVILGWYDDLLPHPIDFFIEWSSS